MLVSQPTLGAPFRFSSTISHGTIGFSVVRLNQDQSRERRVDTRPYGLPLTPSTQQTNREAAIYATVPSSFSPHLISLLLVPGSSVGLIEWKNHQLAMSRPSFYLEPVREATF
jgi:hypothetical protein